MSILNYGQPLGCVKQAAYIVPDNQVTMKQFAKLLTAGPWSLPVRSCRTKGIYRETIYTSLFHANVNPPLSSN